MNTKYFREKYQLTQRELSEIFSIPLRTVQSWDYKDNMPEYVWNMLSSYLSLLDAQFKGDIGKIKNMLNIMSGRNGL